MTVKKQAPTKKTPREVADELRRYFESACSEMANDDPNGKSADDLFDDVDTACDLLGDRVHEECSTGFGKVDVDRALGILDELEKVMPHLTSAWNSLETSFKRMGR